MGAKRVILTSQDLIRFEHALKDEIAGFIPFSSYSLYFPQEMPYEMRDPDAVPGELGALAIHLPKERKLLLPLVEEGRFLGVFQARGVTLAAPKSMRPFLVRMASLCLDKLAMYKRSVTEPMSGLQSRQSFFDAIEREIDVVRNCMRPGASCADFSMSVYRAGLGVLAINLDGLPQVQRQYGFLVAERLVGLYGEAVERARPKQAHAAHLGDGRFALFMPEAMPNASRKLGEALVRELDQVRYRNELTDERVRSAFSVGLANYPQDMEGRLFELPIAEQARLLLHKAQKAAAVAKEHSHGAVFPYARILEDGGRVKDTLPANRLLLSLGRDAGAKDGQRFLVWSPGNGDVKDEQHPPVYKGEVAVMEVLEHSSLAEVMHQNDPSWDMEPGDCLTLLKESLGASAQPGQATGAKEKEASEQRDVLTGLLLYRDFLLQLTRERERCKTFVLALVRLGSGELDHTQAEQQAAQAATLAREIFSQDDGAALLGGRYSLNSLLLFHPEMDAASAKENYEELASRLERMGISVAVGLACHPFLNFRKADALDNARKALEYAMLLPAPHVGVVDSLALNISADKQFSQGDLYGAVEEYKLSLLADEDNNLARNSLGICLARLGRLPQARQHFEEVLSRDKKDVMALYNLGHVCQRMGEANQARKAYKRCLELEPGHVYALIRLGQLSEQQNRLAQARNYYNRAESSEEGSGLTQRYLARLCLRQGRIEEARERLHQALLHDPKDAWSMYLLAKLYLDNGEDPSIAESLARQSVSLRPENRGFWLELARAYEIQGREQEAKEALARAGER